MKQQKIYMKAWLDAHGRAKAVDTDEWYLDFANQLLPLVADSFIYGGREWEEDQKRVALTCALYLEDCVADGGNWRQFIHWHRKSYGRYLPFYALTEEYLPDEINREDIVFLCPLTGEAAICLSILCWKTPPDNVSGSGWKVISSNTIPL